VHSAFTFVYESMIGRSSIKNGDKSIPPGALISFLQKGLQYVGIEETLEREAGKKKAGVAASNPTTESAPISLLSPQTVSVLTRDTPAIQLNVPPATAAAAVKARLEAEAKIETERKAAYVKAVAEQGPVNGIAHITGPNSLPPQATLDNGGASIPPSARDTLAAHAAAQAAAANAMGQFHHPGAVENADAAVLAAQQRRAVAAEMAALQGHQQLQLQHQLQQQEERQRQMLQAQQMANQPDAALEQQTAGTKRGLGKKGKGKPAKQQKQSQEASSAAPQSNKGFASLEEAVARLEASNTTADGNKDQPQTSESQAVPMEVEASTAKPAHAGIRSAPAPATSQELVNGTLDRNGAVNGGAASKPKKPSKDDEKIDQEDALTQAKSEEVLDLKMHSSEVFMCAWNPVFTNVIATGSGDASARIWEMSGAHAADGLGPVRLLPHGTGEPQDQKNKDVTTLEWSSDGQLLATGSYDGIARVWARDGSLVHTLRGHKGPIFSLKWNKRGNYLLSGSYDQTTIVWDVSGSTGFVEQQFNDHQAPALDVDWKDDTTFASCSTDRTVHICRVGVPRPLKIYAGHTDEVNAVKWDPSGTLLASCSDDCTAKVWDAGSDRTDPLHNFKDHEQEIYTVKWYVFFDDSLTYRCFYNRCLFLPVLTFLCP
jgi:hypothetical protein